MKDMPAGTFVQYPTTRSFGMYQTSQLLDAAADRVACIFRVPKTGTITGIDFRTLFVTNNPDNGLRVGLQDVDLTTGFPDGIFDQSVVVNPAPFAQFTLYSATFTGRSVTRGDLIAAVVQIESFVAGDSINISLHGELRPASMRRPYVAVNAGAGYATHGNFSAPAMALKYDDSTTAQVFAQVVVSDMSQVTLNTGSSPDELGNRFELDWPTKCCGAWFFWDVTGSANGDFAVVLYDAANNVLATADHDGDTPSSGNVARGVQWPAVMLEANTPYRVVLKPKTATNVGMQAMTFGSAGLRAGTPWGTKVQRTHRTDAGAWTDTSTEIVHMGLYLNGFQAGARAFLSDVRGTPYPALQNHGQAAPLTGAGMSLVSGTDKVAWICRSNAPGTIERVLFTVAAATLVWGGGSVLRVSLQNVAAGLPDETADQFRTITGGALTGDTMIDSGIISSDGTDGGAKRTVAAGELFAVVFEITTFTAGDNVVFQRLTGNVTANASWVQARKSGTWTRSVNIAAGAVRMTTGYVHVPGIIPLPSTGTTYGAENVFNSGSTPDEIGIRFKVPHNLLVVGFWWCGAGQAGDAEMVLYEGTMQVAISPTLDADTEYPATSPAGGFHYDIFLVPYELRANVEYRLCLRPTSGSNCSLGEYIAIHTAAAAAMNSGPEWYKTSRTNAGAFSEDQTRQPLMGLLVESGNLIPRLLPSYLTVPPIPRVGRGARGIRKQRGAWRRRIT